MSDFDAIVLKDNEFGFAELVGDWPEGTGLTLELLQMADGKYIRVRGNTISFRVVNGKADYEIVGYKYPGVLLLERA